MFVSWTAARKGKPVSHMSHWIVDAICLSYGAEPPGRVRAPSTRSLETSWALFRGVAAQDICEGASWATLNAFLRIYRLDVAQASLAHVVLEMGS